MTYMYSHPRRYVVIHRHRGFTTSARKNQTETGGSRSVREGERECRRTGGCGGIEKPRKRDKQNRFFGGGDTKRKVIGERGLFSFTLGVGKAKIRIQIFQKTARHGVFL